MKFIAKDFNELTVDELYEILKERSQIFILEKNMHCQDMDGQDQVARHFFLEEDGKILAYLRAFCVGEGVVKIGRVLTVTHGIGLGARLMSEALADIKKNMGLCKILVDAQKSAVGFYEKMGFNAISGEFLEEGVIHIKMAREDKVL